MNLKQKIFSQMSLTKKSHKIVPKRMQSVQVVWQTAADNPFSRLVLVNNETH